MTEHAGESVGLRRAIAGHANCPLSVIASLCVDADADVRRAAGPHMAGNPTMLKDLHDAGASADLGEVAEPRPMTPDRIGAVASLGPWGRTLASRHPNASTDLLDTLAERLTPSVRAALAVNPNASASLLRRVAKPLDPSIAASLAEHPNTPIELLTELIELPDLNVRTRVAAHPGLRLHDKLLLRLAVDGASAVRDVVVRHHVLPDEIRDLLTAAGSSPDLMTFAPPEPSLSAERIDDLAHLGGWGRHLAARHPSTSPATLGRLLTDADAMVRFAAVRHPSRPAGLFDMLIDAGSAADLQGFDADATSPSLSRADLEALTDHGPWARRLAARHPACPAASLDLLAHDDAPAIRAEVARHLNTPSQTIAGLIDDGVPDVRWALSARADLDAAMLFRLSRDPVPSIRLAVIRHPNTDRDTLDSLRRDLDRDVAAAAAAAAESVALG
ncbi:MAG: hypothetical protein AAFY08_05820 [Planctomycetota bacterium]